MLDLGRGGGLGAPQEISEQAISWGGPGEGSSCGALTAPRHSCSPRLGEGSAGTQAGLEPAASAHGAPAMAVHPPAASGPQQRCSPLFLAELL